MRYFSCVDSECRRVDPSIETDDAKLHTCSQWAVKGNRTYITRFACQAALFYGNRQCNLHNYAKEVTHARASLSTSICTNVNQGYTISISISVVISNHHEVLRTPYHKIHTTQGQKKKKASQQKMHYLHFAISPHPYFYFNHSRTRQFH